MPLKPPKLTEAIAGPGHRPDNPQPAPKHIDPTIKGLLISVLVGGGKFSPKKDFVLLSLLSPRYNHWNNGASHYKC